jgi:AraC-like DNA-binding protein
LHYVVSGKGIIRKNGVEQTVGASQCFVIRSGETAFYRADNREPWTYIWLGFRTALPLPEKIAEQDVFEASRYENVFLPIINRKSTEPALSVFLCSKCWELFSLLSEEQDARDSTNIFQKAKKYMENEYMNPITVSELSGMFFMDRTVFSKGFRHFYGISPQDYLCSRRLKKAVEFIQSGEHTLSQVALMCGYGDYSNFSRMFSRRYGISPREYAKKHRE